MLIRWKWRLVDLVIRFNASECALAPALSASSLPTRGCVYPRPLSSRGTKSRSIATPEWILRWPLPPHTIHPPPPASTRNCPLNEGHPPLFGAHWLKGCWAGCLPIPHWLLPRSNFLSPRWRLVEADVWCLDWLSSRGSLFLWAGCRGIEEDLRAHCDPFKFWRKATLTAYVITAET